MIKRYWVRLGLFAVIVGILPFVFECLYRIGDYRPLVTLDYTQGEILNYFASVIALLMALFALFQSLSRNEPKFVFAYDILNEKGVDFAIISIALDGKRDCDFKKICLVNRKREQVILFEKNRDNRFGFGVEAGFEVPFKMELSELRTKIVEAKGSDVGLKHLKIRFTLATGKVINENSKEMRSFFEDVIRNGN